MSKNNKRPNFSFLTEKLSSVGKSRWKSHNINAIDLKQKLTIQVYKSKKYKKKRRISVLFSYQVLPSRPDWAVDISDLGGTPQSRGHWARAAWATSSPTRASTVRSQTPPPSTRPLSEVQTLLLNGRLHTMSCLYRWNISPDVSWDSGGAGLVPGPAGDHPDPQVCLPHGVQQGKVTAIKYNTGN